ncbi:unnamed protein product [Paramecium primaurelia]|uniref:CRC domain-containing protein n=1 Tax=Paramecium primaurelia TaxID=5886 RepID=A0A8S1P8Y1_PARPR|nr:unnamed protein product [Paramecium primaurelia]
MNQYSQKILEKRESFAEIDEQVNLVYGDQVENVIEKSQQPQLKYMMSSSSSNDKDEPIQNSSLKEFHLNSIELKVNNQFQNDIEIQSYKHTNDSVQDFNYNEQNKPMRTRRKLNVYKSLIDFQSENNSSSQNQSIVICKCTKSNCLKLYCKCFHQNKKCNDLCNCIECKNKEEDFGIRFNALEKIKQKLHKQNNDDDLFDISKIWGCNCQKSQCQKNYCECFVRNQKCSSICRCKNCANKKKFPFQQQKKQKIQTQV